MKKALEILSEGAMFPLTVIETITKNGF